MPIAARIVRRVVLATGLLGLMGAAAWGQAEPGKVPPPLFQGQTLDDKVEIGYGVAVADVDGDGKPDILLADKKRYLWYHNPGKPGETWAKHVMVENLTAMDNVCIAARDIDGDGKAEVAVGAMWNPGETRDPTKSGSVHFLVRPADPTQKWTPVQLHHEVTTHRMRWVKIAQGKYQLVVVPLHGLNNKAGQGPAVNILAYAPPADPRDPAAWKTHLVHAAFHMTHNFDVVAKSTTQESLIIGGKEGVAAAWPVGADGKWASSTLAPAKPNPGPGEVRGGAFPGMKTHDDAFAAIEPMHGDTLVLYASRYDAQGQWQGERKVLDTTLKEGHALAVADFLGLGSPQIAAGWRAPNKDKKVGVKLYKLDGSSMWIDDNGMACEDLAAADLDGDGKPDLIASGRATKNLKIYWNRR